MQSELKNTLKYTKNIHMEIPNNKQLMTYGNTKQLFQS